MRFDFFVMGTRDGGHQAMLDQMVYAEELGFDAVVLGERHFRHGDLLYSSPLTLAAALAAKTRRIRIGLAGRVVVLDHPLHIAEDAATLDVLSGGRLDFGVARRSLDDESHHAFRAPIEDTQARFREALAIIVKAWTEDEFAYEGAYHRIPPVSVFPKPIQKPHPPVSVVAVSEESLRYAANEGFSAILGAIRTPAELEAPARVYTERLARRGGLPNGASLVVNRFIHVAETDRQAREDMAGPFMEFIDRRAPDLKAALAGRYGSEQSFSFGRFADEFCLFGSPATLVRRLRDLLRRCGPVRLLCSLNFITQGHAACVRSMELFAREVMPALRADAAMHP